MRRRIKARVKMPKKTLGITSNVGGLFVEEILCCGRRLAFFSVTDESGVLWHTINARYKGKTYFIVAYSKNGGSCKFKECIELP